jgi:nucleoside-diphosphate-sugar epimerase
MARRLKRKSGDTMTDERFLVTGALGCIGAWTVRQLVNEGVPVWTYDLPGNPHRLQLIMDDAALAKIAFIHGDITDFAAFEKAVVDHRITHIVHLAALQVPFVRADPVQGARVNVVGTTIVFEVAKRHREQVQGLAYASSVGVYGTPDLYPQGPLAHDARHWPTTLYGVFKHANEETARIYWQDYGLTSTGLRPHVIYGPGRDQGMTSTPTKAMVAAAIGKPYRISFGGVVVLQYAEDAARVCVAAARKPLDGAPVFNLGGSTTHIKNVVEAIDAAAPEMAGKITFEPIALPIPEGVDDTELNWALGPITWIPLIDGVQQTIAHFRRAAHAGRINVERAMG